MSTTLFKATLKKNWLLWIIFFGVLTMYLSVMVSMFNADDMHKLNSLIDMFPESMMKAFGFSSIFTNLTGYLASWLYGMLMFAFPMIYSIILANRLVAKPVDNGSFAFLLSTPNSRVKIIFTRGIYALFSVFVLFAAVFGTGVLVCEAFLPGDLDIMAFLSLNFTTMLVNMTAMMICFFFSCLFNDNKLATGFGAGIPIAFLLFNMLGGVSEKSEILKKISIYGLYDPVVLVNDGAVWWLNIFYIAVSVILFALSIVIFKKKRLPI